MTFVTQRSGATRNQSTADFQTKHAFLGGNEFQTGAFKNLSGGSFTLKPLMLVARNTAIAGGLKEITYTDAATNNLADVIGIASHDGDIVLANNGISNITYCTEGTVDAKLLELPVGVTLDTAVGNKVLRDVLAAIGFDLETTTVEMTKFDN